MIHHRYTFGKAKSRDALIRVYAGGESKYNKLKWVTHNEYSLIKYVLQKCIFMATASYSLNIRFPLESGWRKW